MLLFPFSLCRLLLSCVISSVFKSDLHTCVYGCLRECPWFQCILLCSFISRRVDNMLALVSGDSTDLRMHKQAYGGYCGSLVGTHERACRVF